MSLSVHVDFLEFPFWSWNLPEDSFSLLLTFSHRLDWGRTQTNLVISGYEILAGSVEIQIYINSVHMINLDSRLSRSTIVDNKDNIDNVDMVYVCGNMMY